jgi:hypothetical protein
MSECIQSGFQFFILCCLLTRVPIPGVGYLRAVTHGTARHKICTLVYTNHCGGLPLPCIHTYGSPGTGPKGVVFSSPSPTPEPLPLLYPSTVHGWKCCIFVKKHAESWVS